MASLPFPGPFSDPGLAHGMLHDETVRSYLRDLPFWQRGMSFLRTCFNAPTFRILRRARLAGLRENTETEFATDRKIHESVGHTP
ncbi:hypothetical protein [Roseobacter sp. HKCCA0434]|uniref:hypothetical protein n=1 Tax=Roseobacter sp. HKCCA0434 TaxID=3079297 RepID=UPI002905E91B|nr:hypothetical protein [Roseobacter sp. HKCCA0434]